MELLEAGVTEFSVSRMGHKPLVSIIIPHFNGKEILNNCLQSLENTTHENKEVILVDNGSTDGSVEFAEKNFPWIQVVRKYKNLGYAGGCNAGIRKARGAYILLLNNDTLFESGWLSYLVEACEHDIQIAACQPKVLSLQNNSKFDYAGAAGGLLDVFGYPFARGRLFFTLENDKHQYDDVRDIFWASGTACLIRKSALEKVGYLDEDFFAHMEEIDLNWRFHLAGYRIISAPGAVVYHKAGSTLKPDAPLKIYLNHRNSLVMLLKNYDTMNLVWIFPYRIILEFVTLFYTLFILDFIRMKAVIRSLLYIFWNFSKIVAKRRPIQRIRKVSDSKIFAKMYRGSIAFDYFVRRILRVQDLKSLRLEYKHLK
jgi:GT2 family glycosyltransferase